MSDNIADVISTSSLLLAVVTALLGVWFADVDKALQIAEPQLRGERGVTRNNIRPVLFSKALPLALGAGVIAIVFLPRSVLIVFEAFTHLGHTACYDDMKAAAVVTECLMLALAFVTAWMAGKLYGKYNRLGK